MFIQELAEQRYKLTAIKVAAYIKVADGGKTQFGIYVGGRWRRIDSGVASFYDSFT